MSLSSTQIPPARGWRWAATLAIGSLWTYLAVVFLLDESVLGIDVRRRYLALAIPAGFAIVYGLLPRLEHRGWVSVGRLQDFAVGGFAVLIALLAADLVLAVYLNSLDRGHPANPVHREMDPSVWIGEGMPRRYHPTEKSFVVHKPSVTMTLESSYGDFYYARLMESPTIVESVLQARPVDYHIDAHGFRETTPLEEARVFALGDSCVYGVGIAQDRTWVELLQRDIGQPTYNLGVSGSSPQQHYEVVEYLLERESAAPEIQELLWLIFEGNDLEEADEQTAEPEEPRGLAWLLRGTVLESLADLPFRIKYNSAIRRLLERELILARPGAPALGGGPFVVDGQRLVHPLYRSDRHGHRLFLNLYIQRAARSQSYIRNHPNLLTLHQTFEAMAELSREHGFRVTVLLAPSAPRLYASYFEHFPTISDEPHFLDEVAGMAGEVGFEVIDLAEELRPWAARELLYWRDGSHWNERGHQVVSAIVAATSRRRAAGRPRSSHGPEPTARTATSAGASAASDRRARALRQRHGLHRLPRRRAARLGIPVLPSGTGRYNHKGFTIDSKVSLHSSI